MSSAPPGPQPQDVRLIEDRARLLHRLVIRLAATADLDDALREVLDAVLEVPAIDAGGIYLFLPGGELELVVHRGLSEAFLATARRYAAEAPQVRLIRGGQPMYVSLARLRRELGTASDVDDGLRASAVVPITYEDRVLGALNAASRHVDDLASLARETLEAMAATVAGSVARVTAERAAAQERRNLLTFFETTNDMLFVVARDGTILYCNPAVERIAGLRPADLKGRQVLVLHPPELAERAAETVARIVSAGSGSCDLPIVGADGRLVPVEINVVSGRWEDRDVLFATARDLSVRRRLEAQLHQAQKIEALGALAAGIAHDFNNVLTALIGYREEIADAVQTGRDPSVDLVEMGEAIDRGADLVKQLMSFARRAPAQAKPVDVAALVRSAAALLRRTLPRSIEIVVETDCSSCFCVITESALTAALLNLAANARDAMDGRGRLALAIRCVDFLGHELDGPLRPGSFVRITVTDTGAGMDEATRARIFEPFFTTKPPGQGTGLGLANVYATVRDANGVVTCRSAPGRGTTFELFLPKIRPPA